MGGTVWDAPSQGFTFTGRRNLTESNSEPELIKTGMYTTLRGIYHFCNGRGSGGSRGVWGGLEGVGLRSGGPPGSLQGGVSTVWTWYRPFHLTCNLEFADSLGNLEFADSVLLRPGQRESRVDTFFKCPWSSATLAVTLRETEAQIEMHSLYL